MTHRAVRLDYSQADAEATDVVTQAVGCPNLGSALATVARCRVARNTAGGDYPLPEDSCERHDLIMLAQEEPEPIWVGFQFTWVPSLGWALIGSAVGSSKKEVQGGLTIYAETHEDDLVPTAEVEAS